MNIDGLYKIRPNEREKVLATLLDAFSDYPKLKFSFPEEKDRKAAVEATIYFYAPYDMEYGQTFSLDEEIQEAVCLVHSDDMIYTEERHEAAGSYGEGYQRAMDKLTPEQQQRWRELFDDLDRLEGQIDLPYPHLYIDYLGVRRPLQGQGRGHKLMAAVCDYAKEQGLPIMLFTNTPEDIQFYESLGFKTVGVAHSEAFGFTNTYMVKDA